MLPRSLVVRKVKRAKRKAAGADSDDSDEEEDDDMDDDDDEDEDEDGGEEVCPVGCAQALYEKVGLQSVRGLQPVHDWAHFLAAALLRRLWFRCAP